MKARGMTRGLELRDGAVCYDGRGSSGYSGTASAQQLRGDTSNVRTLKELQNPPKPKAAPKRKPRAKKVAA